MQSGKSNDKSGASQAVPQTPLAAQQAGAHVLQTPADQPIMVRTPHAPQPTAAPAHHVPSLGARRVLGFGGNAPSLIGAAGGAMPNPTGPVNQHAALSLFAGHNAQATAAAAGTGSAAPKGGSATKSAGK